MIITRTPFRISLFGGGTDIKEFFKREPGQVLSFSIDKYCYVNLRKLPRFFNYTYKIAYSKIETCSNIKKIEHPLVRTAFKHYKVNNLELHYDADLPGRSGIGSSSSFGVGLANALSGINGNLSSKRELANTAINWERNILKEKGGLQDQIAAAYGGLNHIIFNKNGDYIVNPYPINKELKQELNKRMILCYIPQERYSSKYSIQNFFNQEEVFAKHLKIKAFVDESINLLKKNDLNSIGTLLNEAWSYKRSLKKVTTKLIDEIYQKGLENGALGGKLLGAGGGGFLLFWCREGEQKNLMDKLSPLITLTFEIENEGSKIIYYS